MLVPPGGVLIVCMIVGVVLGCVFAWLENRKNRDWLLATLLGYGLIGCIAGLIVGTLLIQPTS